MPKSKIKSTPYKLIRKAADKIYNAQLRAESNRLVAVHGEQYRQIIGSFIKFCCANGRACLLGFPAGRDLALRDLIFRLAPIDCLEKQKEPRAPDWLLEAQERVRLTNDYIHQLDTQKREIEKLTHELEQTKGRVGQPVRRRLPDTRQAVTHKFNVGGHEGYMTVGMFEDGSPGELFVTMAKEGSTIGGLMDTIGTLTSLSFQYGVAVETLAKKFSHQRFEPAGYTTNPEIKTATSIIDYVFRWLEIYFVNSRTVLTALEEVPLLPAPNV